MEKRPYKITEYIELELDAEAFIREAINRYRKVRDMRAMAAPGD